MSGTQEFRLPPLPAPGGLARVFAMPDLNGPRIRLGIVWFALLCGALYGGLAWLGALYALVAGIASLQSAREWQKVGSQPSRLVAFLAAAGMPAAAVFGIGLVGAVALALPAAALLATLWRRRWRTPLLAAAGCTVRVALFAGIAAAAPVIMYRTSVIGAILLIGFICAFDMGNFMFGAEAATPIPGIVAGLAVIAVVAGAISVGVTVFELEPFARPEHAWIFGGVVGLLAPFGEVVASLALPAATAEAPALRRLDSLILSGPAFVVLFFRYLGVTP